MSMVGIYLLLSPLLLLLAVIFWLYPPGSPNGTYGYRTKRSMSSQEAWEFANSLSSRHLLIFCMALNLIQAALFALLPGETAALATAIVMMLGLLVHIPLVERELRNRFE